MPLVPGLTPEKLLTKPQSILDGTILYVGGSGPGNYTKIQDAIDNASSGDTVFVYDDSSPYVEKIYINKSLRLIGENKNTTVINGNDKGSVVIFDADRISLSEFTIKNCLFDTRCAAILLYSNFSTINNTIITHDASENINSYGIYLINSSSNAINNNRITNCYYAGIELDNSHNNTISKNNISNSYWSSLTLSSSSNNTINQNFFADLLCVSTLSSTHNIIHQNTLNAVVCGFFIVNSSQNRITCNNIIKKYQSNSSVLVCAFYINGRNTWDGNYWNKPRFFPKIIFGENRLKKIGIPSFQFDWHPASQPIS